MFQDQLKKLPCLCYLAAKAFWVSETQILPRDPPHLVQEMLPATNSRGTEHRDALLHSPTLTRFWLLLETPSSSQTSHVPETRALHGSLQPFPAPLRALLNHGFKTWIFKSWILKQMHLSVYIYTSVLQTGL